MNKDFNMKWTYSRQIYNLKFNLQARTTFTTSLYILYSGIIVIELHLFS